MEQLKILEIINRWGYLNTKQIALLLNKEVAADWLIRALIDKKLIRVDQLTRKNIYMLSSLGNRKLGKKSKSIRINYNELVHQDLLIKWLCQQSDIISYQTEKELKAENPREKGYPDLLVHYENKEMIIELERTRKSKERFESKLGTYYRDLQNGNFNRASFERRTVNPIIKEINAKTNTNVSFKKNYKHGKVENYFNFHKNSWYYF